MVSYNKNNVIQINEKEYYKQYKDIISKCLKDGYLLPGVLEVIDVPEKFDFTDKELEKIKISETASNNRQQMMIERELRLNMIDSNDITSDVYQEEYVNIENEEVLSFIASYPMFEKILK